MTPEPKSSLLIHAQTSAQTGGRVCPGQTDPQARTYYQLSKCGGCVVHEACHSAIVVPSPSGGDDRTQKQQVNMFYIILLAVPILSYRILTPLGRYDVELWYVDRQTSTDFFVGMPPGLRFIANCFHELCRAEFFIGTCFDSYPFEILPISTLVTSGFLLLPTSCATN